MRTLYARLSIALLLVVTLIGGSFFVLSKFSTANYHEEITQRLNASIAMYVTGEMQLMEQGEVNEEALMLLAQRAMIVNPTVEVYLLDTQGEVIGHAFPPEVIKNDSVDLAPVTALIGGEATMPLRGSDPQNPERKKVFSAHPVMDGDQLQGYLYAILGGQKYDALASDLRGSYIQKLSFGALATIVLIAFIVGLLVFGLLTRRLSRLTGEVQRFAETGFDAAAIETIRPSSAAPGKADEIDQLQNAFAGMAAKIGEQFEGLQETDRLRRELVSNVSHDLRTPLASMHGYVETLLLKNDSLSEKERLRYLEITRKHSLRLRRLIGDLFELSKLDSASIQPQLEWFSLAELLHDISQEFELEAEKRGIHLKVESHQEAAMVHADIGLMQRVLENLIRNALRYTPVDGEISISIAKKPDSIAVAVADTGCGIAENELDRIFDRFYRSEQGEEERSNSAGLGLAIVKRILDLHGSRITVTSQVNEGTRFEFDIPAKAA